MDMYKEHEAKNKEEFRLRDNGSYIHILGYGQDELVFRNRILLGWRIDMKKRTMLKRYQMLKGKEKYDAKE